MIYPFLSYNATLYSTRGTSLVLPGQCVIDCAHQGRCDDDVAHWAPEIERPAELTPELLRAILKEVGAWEEDLADDAVNWQRAIWLAANAMKEDEDPDAAVVLPLTGEQEEDLRELAWNEDGRDATVTRLWQEADDCTDLDAWPNLKTSKERVLELLATVPAYLDQAADYLQPFLDQPEVKGVTVEWDPESASPDSEWAAIFRAIEAADKALWEADVARDIRKLCAYVGAPPKVADRAVGAMETSVRTIMGWAREYFNQPQPQR